MDRAVARFSSANFRIRDTGVELMHRCRDVGGEPVNPIGEVGFEPVHRRPELLALIVIHAAMSRGSALSFGLGRSSTAACLCKRAGVRRPESSE
jgi:hypothetical protein